MHKIKKRVNITAIRSIGVLLSFLIAFFSHSKSDEVIMTVGWAEQNEHKAYTLSQLKKLAPNELTTALPWEAKRLTYQGIYLKDLLNKSNAEFNIRYIEIIAANGYKAKINKKTLNDSDFFLAYQINGTEIPIRKKGPTMVISDLNGLTQEEMSKLSLTYPMVWFAKEIVIYK